jgi:hypothetical protein
MATYVTIPELPSGAALTGLEEFEAVQSATSVKLTAQQIKDFATANASFTTTDSNNNSVTDVLTLTHETSGVPAVGIGTGFALDTEVNTGVVITGSNIASVATDVTPSASNFDLVIKNVVSGTLEEAARVTSDKRLGVGTSDPQAAVQGTVGDSLNTSVVEAFRASHTLSNSAAAGAGSGMAFALKDVGNAEQVTGQVSSVATTAFSNADIVVSVTKSGTLVEAGRFTSDKRLGVGTDNPSAPLEVVLEDSGLSTVTGVGRFTHVVSGTPAVGIGAAIDFQVETAPTVNKIGGAVYAQSTDLTPTQEDFDLGLAVMSNGVAGVEVMRLTSGHRVGVNTTTPQVTYQQATADSATNTVSSVMRLTHTTDGTPAIGFGTSIDFEDETTVGNNEIGVRLCSTLADPTLGSEDFDFSVKTMSAGAAATEKLRVGNAITPFVPFTQLGVGTDPINSRLELGATTATIAPLVFDSSADVFQTTSIAGSMEYTGRAPYFTSGVAGQRGVVLAPQYYQLGADLNGPTTANTAQAATITIASPAVFTVATAPDSNTIITITTTGALPTGLSVGVQYYVLKLSATTFAVSLTQAGLAITTTGTQSGTHTVQLAASFVGAGVNLNANTRYEYDLYAVVAKTSAGAASIQYSLTQTSGIISAHAYNVVANTAAALTTLAAPQEMSNYITTGFLTPVTATVNSAAAASTHIVRITGMIDVGATPIVNMNFCFGFTVAPTATTIRAGAYVGIYPVSIIGTRTIIGSWA